MTIFNPETELIRITPIFSLISKIQNLFLRTSREFYAKNYLYEAIIE